MRPSPSAALIGKANENWLPFEVDCPFGRLFRAICPRDPPAEALAALHAAEIEYMGSLEHGSRQCEWAGGRLCLAAALAMGPQQRSPLLVAESGAPAVPNGWSGSISHKGPLVIALAAPIATGAVGIDLERVDTNDERIERNVLTETERDQLPLDDDARRRRIVMHFSIKEAVYKALNPWDQEDLAFEEIETVLGDLTPRTWLPVNVRLLTRKSQFSAALIFDGDWLIAGALRRMTQ